VRIGQNSRNGLLFNLEAYNLFLREDTFGTGERKRMSRKLSSFILTHQWLGLAYLGKLMYEEALAAFQKEMELSDSQDMKPLFFP